MASYSQQPVPELPRNIACAITLQAKEMEGRPASMVLVPHGSASGVLVAFRRKETGSKDLVATLASWSGHNAGQAVVGGKAAVHLPCTAEQPHPFLVKCLSENIPLNGKVYVVLLNCATLEALLANRLPADEVAVALKQPTSTHLFPVASTYACSNWRPADDVVPAAIAEAQRMCLLE